MDFISRITIGECPDPNSHDSHKIFATHQNQLVDDSTKLQGLPFNEERNEREKVSEKPFLNKRWVNKI